MFHLTLGYMNDSTYNCILNVLWSFNYYILETRNSFSDRNNFLFKLVLVYENNNIILPN